MNLNVRNLLYNTDISKYYAWNNKFLKKADILENKVETESLLNFTL